jgi:coenzyme PQQ synthesis protein D (PqqD)
MDQAIRPNTAFARNADVVGTEVADETVLLNTANWSYLSFDAIGARIWALLETPQSADSLVAALLREFSVDEATCRGDTMIFLQDMLEKGFIAPAA